MPTNEEYGCCVCGKNPGTNWIGGKQYCNDCRPLAYISPEEILPRIKSIIVQLNYDRGLTSDFPQMTSSSKLREFNISHLKERGVFENWFGKYVDITAFHEAVNNHFRINLELKPYETLKTRYYDWVSLSHVAEYVQECLERQRLEIEREEHAQRKRAEQSKRMKEYWTKRKAKEQEEKERREEQKKQERSRRMKDSWAKRKAREQEEKRRREEREQWERSEREKRGRTNSTGDLRTFYLQEILELRPDASTEEIKKRYRELVKKAHPDYGGDPHHFRMIRKAYEYLMDGH